MSDTNKVSLQDQFAAKSICFGCGPANEQGLRIKSFVEGEKIVAYFTPKPHHHAFPGVLNGGIIGAILDCHCNWAAGWFLMQHNHFEELPCTVTAEFNVKLKRPTPMGIELRLVAELMEIGAKKATINGLLLADDVVCDEFVGTFVAVGEGHPAFHRW